MILFISDYGASAPMVLKMRQEGANAQLYIHQQAYKNNYDGILDKVETRDLKKVMTAARKIIFDSKTNLGSLMEGMENKAINFANIIDENLLIEKLGLKPNKGFSGINLITEMWFNGKDPELFTHSLLNKKWLTGNLGIAMESQSSCLWVKHKADVLTENLKRLIPSLSKAGYTGAVSMDCTINSKDKKPYFNSLNLGFRYDSIFCLLSLIGKSITGFINEKFSVKSENFACSERLTIAPYPYAVDELLLALARGIKTDINIDKSHYFWGQDIIRNNDGIECAGNDGILGIVTSDGESIQEGFGKIYKSIRRFNIGSPLQFRIDGAKESNKAYKKLKDWNICIE